MIIEIDELLSPEVIKAIEQAVKPFGYVFYDFAQGVVVSNDKPKNSTMMALVKETK